MNLYSVCGAALLSCAASVIIRRVNGTSNAVPVLFTLILLILSVSAAIPVIGFVRGVDGADEYEKYVSVMLKGVGMGFLGSCAVDVCNSCGEEGIGKALETATRVAILLLCLPLMNDIINVAKTVLSK